MKALLHAAPAWLVAVLLWSLSRVRSVRELLADGVDECRALVDQSGGNLSLSDAGHIFYSSARHSVELASLAEERTRAHLKLTRNRLFVGHSSYAAPRLLEFIRQLKLAG